MTRYIGVSNFLPDRLARAVRCSEAPIVVNQVHYSLKFREPESSGLLGYCQEHDILLQAWRPLRGVAACPLTDELCEKYGLTLAQLGLAWLLSQKSVTAITAMKNPVHLPENLKAVGTVLADADVERLRNEFPDRNYISTVPLR